MIDDAEIDERFDLIQGAVNRLHRNLTGDEIDQISDFIEALCRHQDLPVDAVDVSLVVQTPMS